MISFFRFQMEYTTNNKRGLFAYFSLCVTSYLTEWIKIERVNRLNVKRRRIRKADNFHKRIPIFSAKEKEALLENNNFFQRTEWVTRNQCLLTKISNDSNEYFKDSSLFLSLFLSFLFHFLSLKLPPNPLDDPQEPSQLEILQESHDSSQK